MADNLKVEISECTFSESKTKPWFVTFDFDGEQHLITVPYKKYAQLLNVALSETSVYIAREILKRS